VIEVRVEFNGSSKITLHPVEERDVRVLDLSLTGVEILSVKKIGADYFLTPAIAPTVYHPGEENDSDYKRK
jgi:hypothetical protein